MKLTQEYLKSILDYSPETGHFTWKVSPSRSVPKFTRAGRQMVTGYRQIQIKEKCYSEHRLAFLYMTGTFPPVHVDHINRVRDDNRWINLRHANYQTNRANRKTQVRARKTGVTWQDHGKPWRVTFRHLDTIGYFDCYLDACSLRIRMENKSA